VLVLVGVVLLRGHEGVALEWKCLSSFLSVPWPTDGRKESPGERKKEELVVLVVVWCYTCCLLVVCPRPTRESVCNVSVLCVGENRRERRMGMKYVRSEERQINVILVLLVTIISWKNTMLCPRDIK
jgi:hypothetical protein